MDELEHELRSDGVLYPLKDGISAMVRGNGATKVTVILKKDDIVVPPETGNLGGSTFRNRLVSLAEERFGEVNGLADQLGLIGAVFDEHLRERQEAAEEHFRENEVPELAGTPYTITEEGGFARIKYTQAGEVLIPLTNFVARVEEQVIRDDGAEKTRIYRIAGQIGERDLPSIDVPVSQFDGLRWVAENWGLAAHITAGQHQFAKEAIELYSKNAAQSYRFAHTGWRILEDGRRVFLHSGGDIA